MTFRVEVVCLHDGGEQRCSVAELERAELALQTFGMSVAEGKAILHGVQDFIAGQQVTEDLKRKRVCPTCGQRYHSKEAGTHTVKTVFGRWRCRTRGGSVAHAKAKGRGPSVRLRPGCKGHAPVQRWSIWRPSGPR